MGPLGLGPIYGVPSTTTPHRHRRGWTRPQSIATAVEVSAPGLLELWHFCRAATGLEGAALDIVNVMSHFNSEDESTLLALRDTLGAMDPTMSR